MERQQMEELAEIISKSVVAALKESGLVGKADKVVQGKPKSEKTAYQKTEQLLFAYNGLNRIVAEKQQEIADLRKYGVPKRSGSIVQYSPGGNTVRGTVLKDEAVETAVHAVEASVQETVHAIALVDKCMAALKSDPYYDILPMRYFEGRTHEDIGVYFGVDHTTISRNKSRLVKELAMRLFPDEMVKEFMN